MLHIQLNGNNVWGGAHGLEWTWVELLEHLARFWPFLLLEELDPLGLGAPPESLRKEAERRWEGLTEAQSADEEAAVHAYLEAHDLAAGLGGVFPAPLFVTREGANVRIAARTIVVRVSLEEFHATMTSLGSAIAARLGSPEAIDERARAAVAGWSVRELPQHVSAAAVATGLPPEQVRELLGDLDPALLNASVGLLRDPNEFLAAARMTSGVLSNHDVKRVLAAIARQPLVPVDHLDDLGAKLMSGIDSLALRSPWGQGYRVAEELRRHLRVSETESVDPSAQLAIWNIPLGEIEIESENIDALCVWGPRHGPAVLVNPLGRHCQDNALRATLAHEIGHLLMDRNGGLPVGEVLGGNVPQELEKRARSFAAEFLLPRAIAHRRIMNATDVHREVCALSEEFGVRQGIIGTCRPQPLRSKP